MDAGAGPGGVDAGAGSGAGARAGAGGVVLEPPDAPGALSDAARIALSTSGRFIPTRMTFIALPSCCTAGQFMVASDSAVSGASSSDATASPASCAESAITGPRSAHTHTQKKERKERRNPLGNAAHEEPRGAARPREALVHRPERHALPRTQRTTRASETAGQPHPAPSLVPSRRFHTGKHTNRNHVAGASP